MIIYLLFRGFFPPGLMLTYRQGFQKDSVSKFAGNLKTGCPNCSLSTYLHLYERC